MQRYDPMTVLHSWVVSHLLRSDETLRMNVDYCMKLMLPPTLRDLTGEHVDSANLVSATTLSNNRLRVDSAFMMLQKRLHKPPAHVDPAIISDPERLGELFMALDVARQWWLDSSPQGGVDWEVVVSTEIKLAHLRVVLDLRDQLAVLGETELDLDGERLSVADQNTRKNCEDMLGELVTEHRWPLTSLGGGKGSTNLPSKTCCWAHSCHLEAYGALSLRWIMACSTGATVDLGTESLVGKAVDVDVRDAFPENCGPVRSLLVDGVVDDDDTDPTLRENSVRACCFPTFMPFGLVSLGNMHILDNIMHETLLALPFWPWLKPLLKAVTMLLHTQEHLQRLVERCCPVGTGLNHLAVFFKKPLCPAFRIHRWQVIIAAARAALKVKGPLRRVWDRATFVGSADADADDGDNAPGLVDDDNDDDKRLDCKSLDIAITANRFWSCTATVDRHALPIEIGMHWSETCDCHEHSVLHYSSMTETDFSGIDVSAHTEKDR